MSATTSRTALLALAILISAEGRGDEPYRLLPADFNSDKTQQMMRAYLRKEAHRALDRRLAQLEQALTSPEKFAKYQQQRRDDFRRALGEMPERTPLNAQLTGRVEQDGFWIEKVLLESQPGFHVTANLYRPRGEGPFPAVLHPVGHSENGKAYDAYQRANRLLVRHGFLVLCYDPIGQGERKQLFGDDGRPLQRASGEHLRLGAAPILLGRGLGSYMVWDGVRAIDYLCNRDDVDPRRIGCLGISGGGNMTSYLMAYDDRIAAAAPGCFVTTHRRKNERPGPGDAEQNVYGQIREGFDHPDFLLARAPRPTLILAATHDFVPIEGTWEAFRQAKRAYSLLGHGQRVDLVEANAKHGFGRPLREASVRFMAHWLQRRVIDVSEAEDELVLPETALQVTPDGQVMKLPGELSLLDLYAQRERELAERRPELTRDVVRRVAGIRPLDQLPRPELEVVGDPRAVPRRLLLRPEPGIVLPALFWPGDQESRTARLLAPADGINSVVADARRMNAAGHAVLVVEVRDTGETATRNWRFFGADYYIAYMLGRSYLGMQAEDLLVAARWLAEQSGSDTVGLAAWGAIGPAALHAAAVAPERIKLQGIVETSADDGLTDWRGLMTDIDAYDHQHQVVHDALRFYDLPDLKKLVRGH